MEGIEVISRGRYRHLPWHGEELSHKLEVLLQDLKPGLKVSNGSLAETLSSPQSHLFFAVYTPHSGESELVGYAELLEWHSATGRAGYVENVVVKKEFQGRGIGSTVIAALIEVAQVRHLHALWLHSGEWRTGAHALYKKHGFERKDTIVLCRDM